MFWGGFYVPCDRNPHAINAQMIDEDEVVAPALVPDRPSSAAVSPRNVRPAVSARQVTEAIFGTHVQRNAPGAVTAPVQEQHHTNAVTVTDAVTASVTTASRLPVTEVTEAISGTRLHRNTPGAVTASVLEQHHTDAVTASRKSEPRRRVHAPVQEPHHKDAVTASVITDALSITGIRAAAYAAQWQAKMSYCF